MTDPFMEIRSPWPARIGYITAGAVTVLVAMVVLFALLPPVLILPERPPLVLDATTLAAAISEAWWIADCSDGLLGLLGVPCRADAAWRLLAKPDVAAALQFRAIVTLVATVTAAWIAASRIATATPKHDRVVHIRGRCLHQDADARHSMRRYLVGIGVSEKTNLWLSPRVQLTPIAESYNILAIGTQGAGKTGLLRAWIEQIIARGDRLIVHDVKGDVTAGLPAERFILVAPHDIRSAAWDIARDIADRPAALEFAARSIKTAHGDTMWADGAKALFADAIVALIQRHGDGWTLRDLYELLTSPPDQFKAALVASGAASAELIAFDDSGVQRTSMSLLITLWVAVFTTLKPLVDAWAVVPKERCFSLRDWLRDGRHLPRTIIIQKSAVYPELSALVGGLLVERLAGALLAPGRPRNHGGKVALVLDELAELGHLRRLPNLLSVGREVGVLTIAAVQDLGQLVEIYGETVARTLESRFGIKVVGRLTAGDTAERISKVMIGERLVQFMTPSDDPQRPGACVRHRETHPVFPVERLETELGVRTERGRLLVRHLVLGLGDPALVDTPFTSWPDRRPAVRPATWVRGAVRPPPQPGAATGQA